MEFTSLIKRERVKNTFEQINNAIINLKSGMQMLTLQRIITCHQVECKNWLLTVC